MTFRSVQLGAWVCLASAVGCSANNFLTRLTVSPSPHERYADVLRAAPLAGTAMAQDWLRAAEAALQRPLAIALPLGESGYFPADSPTATAYQIELTRGRRLSVEITFDSVDITQLFVDLFQMRGGEPPDRVASAPDGRSLTYDVPRDGVYVLRVQPELLRSGRYTIVQRTLASLRFPVTGLTAAAVQSEFGAARDAGRREHEGIDIFAARNTPVIAVVDGTAQPGVNALGGNVVWLRGRGERRSFYYAHLTRPAFEAMKTVAAGEIVGYVGNTGNARSTAPHLHFGIYEGGAIDPLPFLRADDPVPAAAPGAGDWLEEMVRVTTARTTLRAGTSHAAPAVAQLGRASLARVAGVAATQLRVVLPDRATGYIDRSAVAVATSALRRQRLVPGSNLREKPSADAPTVRAIEEATTADVIGEFNGFELVRTSSGFTGWLASTPQ
jgi:murein DD-endopeptidase MepM/ murein hydrolase activator NlpD